MPTKEDLEEDYERHLQAAKLLAKASGRDVYLIRIEPGSLGRATTRYAIQVSNDGYRPRELITAKGEVFECSQFT